MFTPQNSQEDFSKLKNAFLDMCEISKDNSESVEFPESEQIMTIRQAVFSENEEIYTDDALNRVCASPTVSCPPAIPIAVSGEKITQKHIDLFKKYNIDKILVVK